MTKGASDIIVGNFHVNIQGILLLPIYVHTLRLCHLVVIGIETPTPIMSR